MNSPAAPGTRTVLLIDDDRLQARLVAQFFANFRGEKFRLVAREDYEGGLWELCSGAHAACLLDYQLQGHDGLELLRAAKAAGAHTPVIFLTSETDPGVDEAALEAGALDYLLKGEITAASLERSLRYALRLEATIDQLRKLAATDALTGLPNRREFERRLSEEIERARRFARPCSVVLLDVDHFKQVNDRAGHAAGDALLRRLGATLARGVRDVDTLARLGGDEFACLLLETSAEGAQVAAQRLVATVRAETGCTISAGVAEGAASLADGAALLAAADRALYAAKAAGRDRVG
jgi:two-component system, cell cycle response regulator